MKKITKNIFLILAIMIVFNFIFPLYASAYRIENIDGGLEYHFITESLGERRKFQRVETKVINNVKDYLNDRIKEFIEQAGGVSQLDENAKKDINKKLMTIFDNDILEYGQLRGYFWNNTVGCIYYDNPDMDFEDNFAVSDFVKSYDFLQKLKDLKNSVEKGEYLDEYIDKEEQTTSSQGASTTNDYPETTGLGRGC